MEIRDNWRLVNFSKIIDLYDSVGWEAYTADKMSLVTAFTNSDYVMVFLEGQQVIGLVRSISDDVSIHYLQDIIVHPDHQRKGIGRKLFDMALKRYSHVRSHILLTDDEDKQKLFYESLGYQNTKQLVKTRLNCFVKMDGIS